jgi:hypothetical protein
VETVTQVTALLFFLSLFLLPSIPLLIFGLAALSRKYSDPVWTDIGWPFGAILIYDYFSDRLSTVSFKKGVLAGLSFFTPHSIRSPIPMEDRKESSGPLWKI